MTLQPYMEPDETEVSHPQKRIRCEYIFFNTYFAYYPPCSE